MASSSHGYSGIWADLPTAPKNSNRPTAVAVVWVMWPLVAAANTPV